MNELREHHRQAIRAAIRIHTHLNSPACSSRLDTLPQGRWNELGQVYERFQLAQDRGWQAARGIVARDLEYQLRRLKTQLEVVREGLQQAEPHGSVSPASTIAADLLALNDEFEAVRIDLKNKTVQVHTAGIVLEDIDLRAFRIVLHWERIGVGRNRSSAPVLAVIFAAIVADENEIVPSSSGIKPLVMMRNLPNITIQPFHLTPLHA